MRKYVRVKPYKHDCPLCGKNFPAYSQHQRYCSRKCSNKARTGIKYTGEQPRSKVRQRDLLRMQVEQRDGKLCLICRIGELWNGKFLKLQVDHIDGNGDNNDLSNLRLLCPNCHSQTETFGGKNIRRVNPRGAEPALKAVGAEESAWVSTTQLSSK